MIRAILAVFIPAVLSLPTASAADLVLENGLFKMTLNQQGVVEELLDTSTGRNYVQGQDSVYFCHVRMYDAEQHVPPTSMSWTGSGSEFTATVQFACGVNAEVLIERKGDYFTFELSEISRISDVEFFVWGPYLTTIYETVGGSAGIARNDEFALGIRPLNYKTQGGSDYECLTASKSTDGSLAVRLAADEGTGSRLGAYTKDRTRTQEVARGAQKLVLAKAIPSETVVGSKIAILGAPESEILDLLERMVKAEGLPYPTWHGEWAKRSRQSTRPRLIIPYSETNVEQCIRIAEAGRFAIVYHKTPYESKGTFEPRKDDFPDGWAGLRMCADKIRAAGLEPGMHNLSTFMNPTDLYCSPVPHEDLAIQGMTTLGRDLGLDDKQVVLAGGAARDVYDVDIVSRKPIPKVVRIGNEFIQYRAASENDPMVLLDCVRGAWGTRAAAHKAGDSVGKLMTHKYKVFFPDIELLPEIARNLAQSCNQSGIRSVSFDGLEGTRMTGHGMYSQALFAWTFWNTLEDKQFISSSSRPGEFYWYLNSHQSWGEPHGEGFRHDRGYYEGKIAGRIKDLLIPNFIPYRLGQYQFSKLSTITDIEWLMTKCAGLGGGFDLYITPSEYEASGEFGRQVMETIRLWEEARLKDVFTPQQKRAMEKYETVFRLKKKADGGFEATQLSAEEVEEVIDPVVGKIGQGSVQGEKGTVTDEYFHKNLNGKSRILPAMLHHVNHIEPGGESDSLWVFANDFPEQPLQFVIQIASGETASIEDPVLVLNGVREVKIDLKLRPGQYISSAGDGTATLYDERTHKVIQTVEIPTVQLLGRKGKSKPENSISFNHDRGLKNDRIGPDVLVSIRIHKPPKNGGTDH